MTPIDACAGDRFEARVSHPRTLLLVALNLGFVALGIWLVADAETVARTSRRAFASAGFVTVIGGMCVLLFGAFAVIGIGTLRHRGAVLRLDAKEIYWARWSDRPLPWHAIESIDVTRIQRRRFLSLWLHDPAAHPPATLVGRLAGANRKMGHGDIAVTMAGTDRSFAELLAAVERFAPQSLPNTDS